MNPEALPTLKDAFDALDQHGRRAVQRALCHRALRAWEAYVQRYGPIMYVDSVVGMEHCVDSSVPRDAVASVVTVTHGAGRAYPLLAAKALPLCHTASCRHSPGSLRGGVWRVVLVMTPSLLALTSNC